MKKMWGPPKYTSKNFYIHTYKNFHPLLDLFFGFGSQDAAIS
jgi:hypothetical protein